MDGIDGLAGSETIAVALGYLALLTYAGLEDPFWRLALVIAASAAGYLFWNWHPAKVFMGDSGSIPLGFLLGWLMLDLALAGQWAAGLILPLYFVADATFTLLARARRGEKLWQAHRQHFYQRAVLGGATPSGVVWRVGATNAVLIVLALRLRPPPGAGARRCRGDRWPACSPIWKAWPAGGRHEARALREHRRVGRPQRLLDVRLGEAVQQPQARRLAHAPAQVRIARQPLQGVGERVGVLRRHHEAFHAVAHEVAASRHVGDDERTRARRSLQQRARHALPAARRQDEDVGAPPHLARRRRHGRTSAHRAWRTTPSSPRRSAPRDCPRPCRRTAPAAWARRAS